MFNILCANTIQIMYTFTGWVLGTAGYVPVLKITQSLTCCDPQWQGDISDVTFLTTNTSNTHTPAGNVFTSQQQSGNIYIYPNIEVRDRSGRSVSASTNFRVLRCHLTHHIGHGHFFYCIQAIVAVVSIGHCGMFGGQYWLVSDSKTW